MDTDLVIQKLIELDEKVSKLAPIERLDQLENRIIGKLDKQYTVLSRLDLQMT